MRILVAEDDFVSRKILTKFLVPYGECDVAANGLEALEAFKLAWEEKKPYDLICLDIMMPKLDGQEALKSIRSLEQEKQLTAAQEVKIMMVSALDDARNIVEAYYQGGASAYVVKPITQKKITSELRKLQLIS